MSPIGVFDSGYGGLTILRELRKQLPEYDYIYLGDNARAPYGTRSFPVVLDFTRQAVEALFDRGCPLVILACNTASAKALRSIQQLVLPFSDDPTRRVLGVIRPTVEVLPTVSRSGHIGVLATPGTVASHSYFMEMEKIAPAMKVTEVAAPMWVPLVENRESDSPGADYFVKKYLDRLIKLDSAIDTIVLGCTHYPLLIDKIRKYAPGGCRILAQGDLVSRSLVDYLRRHPEMDNRLSKGGSCRFYSTESSEKFDPLAAIFMGHDVDSQHIDLK